LAKPFPFFLTLNQTNMMEQDLTLLKKMIRGSYGSDDLKFGGHALDSGRARESLTEAGRQEIGHAEYLDMHRSFLSEKGCSAEHIAEQLIRVKDLSYYFSYD
jgi:hypothetical protein